MLVEPKQKLQILSLDYITYTSLLAHSSRKSVMEVSHCFDVLAVNSLDWKNEMTEVKGQSAGLT